MGKFWITYMFIASIILGPFVIEQWQKLLPCENQWMPNYSCERLK